MDKLSECTESGLSRRGLVCALGAGAVGSLMSLGSVASASSRINSALAQIGDGDILTFALNLEYLEAEFYSVATMGRPLGAGDISGVGNAGRTTGGRKVPFQNENLGKLAREIAKDELDHVRFLRTALGSAAVAKPAINLDALGIGFKNEGEFIVLARAFEDVGVSAYRGAAKLIKNTDYLDAAAGILATEAYHAGHLRSHAIYANAKTPELDAKDQAVTPNQWIPTDGNGIAIGRTPEEVGKIVRGPNASGGAFFPNGMNGKIR